MRRVAFTFALTALLPLGASAQLATTKFYNFVDTAVTVTFSNTGTAQIKLAPAGAIISVTGYRKVSVQIGTTHATNLRIQMGKITGATLSQYMFNGPVDQKIHTFEVVGPDLVLVLSGAPANSTDHVQVWVYLTT